MRDFDDPQYKLWRKRVYARDGFRCQMPGCTSPKTAKLNAHHIKRWADSPSLRFVVSNGITLCRHCHDSIQGRETSYEATFQGIVAGKRYGGPGPGRGGLDVAMQMLRLKYRSD